jgi:hypothetical protein
MTETQWAAELADCCRHTNWVVERSGITRMFRLCLARLHNTVTQETIHIDLSERFRTPGARTREILRQLAR